MLNVECSSEYIGQMEPVVSDETESVKQAENSDEVFLLCDSSKIEKDLLVEFVPLSTLDFLITDKNVNFTLIPKYDKQSIKLLCDKSISN